MPFCWQNREADSQLLGELPHENPVEAKYVYAASKLASRREVKWD
eukprot:CAMPEP_0184030828 /NCGR_PEP_ID=MMETSP0955-20130417/1759_1 /TAXON_ID=627963 /ORGANISM="Aplanochytrium sp, Strain PBS07" /LENGTH=44 /DNA_ID= /DNA_START= /DNA_END= /DNA_ORIENTATION=